MRYWIMFCTIFELFVKQCLSCDLWSGPGSPKRTVLSQTSFEVIPHPTLWWKSYKTTTYGHKCKVMQTGETLSCWYCCLIPDVDFVLWEAIILFVANTYFVQTGFEWLTFFMLSEKCWFCRDFWQLILFDWKTEKGKAKIPGFTSVSLNILRLGKLPGIAQLDLFVMLSLRVSAFCICLLVCLFFFFVWLFGFFHFCV